MVQVSGVKAAPSIPQMGEICNGTPLAIHSPAMPSERLDRLVVTASKVLQVRVNRDQVAHPISHFG